MLEELGGETGIRSEQQRLFAIDHTGVQVRHRHRRRADGSLAVNLGLMQLDHFRVIATQPLAADREAAIAFAFFDARGLQQRQGRATGAQEYELGINVASIAAVGVLDAYCPAVTVTLEAGDFFAVLDLGVRCTGQMLEQLLGQGAEVDIGAMFHAGGRDELIRRAARHHQGHPLGHFGLVFGVFHVGKRMVLAQHVKAFFQERHAFFAFNVAQVRNRADEGLAGTEGAFLRQVGPKLFRHFELGIDMHSLFDVDRTISRLRRVVQLTKAGVTGACVVPRVGTLRST